MPEKEEIATYEKKSIRKYNVWGNSNREKGSRQHLKKQITSTIDSNAHAKIFSMLLHAHFMNTAKPESYETQLNKTLKANNFPPIKTPTVSDSNNILKSYIPTENQP